jgi:hypothetical protein
MKAATPTKPSLPTIEISADAPFPMTYNDDTMQSVGK